jgi:hypothetical protein
MKARPHLNLVFLSGLANPLQMAGGDRRFFVCPAPPRRFRVRATRADGRTTHYTAIGGTSCGHLVDAIDLAGLGGVVSVQPLHEADAA